MAKVSDFQNKIIPRSLRLLWSVRQNGLGRCVFVVFILLLVTFPSIAQAHSSGPPRLADAVAGPYRIFVWTQPEPLRVGDVHISILVTQGGTDSQGSSQPVHNANVELQFELINAPSQRITVAASPQEFLSNIYYEADVQLRSSGQWRATINVAGIAGKGNVAFESTVLPARTLNWWLIGGTSVLLIVLLSLIGIWSRVQALPHPC